MKKGRSTYNFHLSCDSNKVNELIQSYLNANGFQLATKKGETYYQAGDEVMGYRYFNYHISENNLTISAWWPHAFLGEMCIEQTGLGNINMMIKSYRNSLNTLFQEIEKLNQNNTASFDNNINQSTQLFQNETSKKEEMLCEIAFWASILGVFITVFFGRMFGLIVQVLIIYYAIKGLHTKKRIKAIIAIILSVISLAIFVLSFLLAIIQ